VATAPKKPDDAPQGDAAAPAVAEDITVYRDSELVYVVNPQLQKDAATDPAPARMSREWLRLNADKGWVEANADGTSKES
jgi:hypothetical protein